MTGKVVESTGAFGDARTEPIAGDAMRCITYGVDAARTLMLDADAMTVVGVTRFEGLWNPLGPALAVLVAPDLVLGAVAVYVLNLASSSATR